MLNIQRSQLIKVKSKLDVICVDIWKYSIHTYYQKKIELHTYIGVTLVELVCVKRKYSCGAWTTESWASMLQFRQAAAPLTMATQRKKPLLWEFTLCLLKVDIQQTFFFVTEISLNKSAEFKALYRIALDSARLNNTKHRRSHGRCFIWCPPQAWEEIVMSLQRRIKVNMGDSQQFPTRRHHSVEQRCCADESQISPHI